MTEVRAGSLRAWILASRPATLTAAIVPVLVGSAVAHAVGGFRLLPALAALVGAMLIQIATNFANDVFDHEKGADTEDRLGPTRATASGLLTARQMRAALVTTLALTLIPGAYLVWVGGWPIVVIGIASMLSGVAYTGGPYPLGYHGLGDVFVFVFFGLVAVCGTVFVQANSIPLLAWLAASAVGAIATAILVVNNVRDRETDVKAGKRTLAVRLGKRGGIIEYVGLFVVAYAVPVLAIVLTNAGLWVLLPLMTVPLAVHLAIALATKEGRPLNAVLGQTAMLLLVYGVLLSVGLVLSPRGA
ncbi:MAG: 1,4-dihydroxy-2-naphthoate polyprenyltransferase [Polyangiaceae bacterium]|nr:1,4-dihydroxy-2-naphthoate polyprenyltransferase [Polyangiaceae bacterium]